MPTFKLDEREIPFEKGETIIQAAHRAGIDIPHYCWHPGLSVAANCRMCLVEIEPPPGRPAMMLDVLEWDADAQDYVPQKKPKLQPACQFQAGEGMVVHSEGSKNVKEARRAVQEMLLLNHPVDCPICDQAGECRLQDYWLEHQGSKKRMKDEPVHKPKAVVFGPTIVYDAERCIVCTRCIRFCDEVAGDSVLDLRERGNLNEVVLAPGRELDHDYTLMTEYVCPVGALTAVDFRFKARVWFLRSARTVCVGCATGCNAFLDFDPRDQKVYRHRPRENPDVNKYWMCDEGMLSYSRVHENRVLRAEIDGQTIEFERGLKKAAKLFKSADPDRTAIVLSAQHSNEDNFAMLVLARDYIGSGNVFVNGRPGGDSDEILRDADKNPNARGVVGLCTSAPPAPFKELATALAAGKFTHVLALGSDASDPDEVAAFEDCENLVLLTSHRGPLAAHADALLPACTWAEADGTFVNRTGIAQESERAIFPHGDSLPAWKLIAAFGRALGHSFGWTKLRHVRAAMAPDPGAEVAADAEAQSGAPA